MTGGEVCQMHRHDLVATRHAYQIHVEHVCIEGGDGSHQLGYRLQTGVECLIGRELVSSHAAAPEAFAVQTDIPVGKVVVHEILYQSAGLRGLVVVVAGIYLLHQRVQYRQNPAVNLRTFVHRHVGFSIGKSVHIGIESEEGVGVVQRSEELAAHLLHTVHVKLQVVPRRRVGNHIPAQGVRAILLDGREGVYRIAQALRHLVSVLVEHQSVGDDRLVADTVKHHGGDGMERKKPATCLVNALGDEVGGIYLMVVQQFLVFKRIVNLCIGHGTGVKPYVNQVRLALHRLTVGADQHNLVHIWAVQVYLVIILLRIYAGLEAAFLVGIALHHTGGHSLLHFIVQLFHRLNALLLASVLGAPDRQWRTPVARAAQVPVVQVFQPFAEAACAGRFGLPVDGLVELHHTFLAGRRADKPAVQRIVQHRLVRTPAMRIVVYMLLHLEGLVGCLHLHADVDIQAFGCLGSLFIVLSVYGKLRVVGILHPASFILFVCLHVHTFADEAFVQFVQQIELAGQVHHRSGFTPLVNHEERRYAGSTGHVGIVGTEGRCDMYDTRTIFGSHIISGDDAERLSRCVLPVAISIYLYGFHPRHQLLVLHAHQFGTLILAYHLEGYQLVARLIVLQRNAFSLLVEVCIQQGLGQDNRHLLAGVGVVGLHGHVVNLRSHTESRVAGQCPGCGGPGQEVGCAPGRHFGLGLLDAELSHYGQVLHVAVAPGLVQLVRTQSGAGSGRIGLDGVALVEESLLVELLQQPPQRFDVAVVVCDVGVFQVHPIAHLVGQVGPLLRKLHHVLAAGRIVVGHGDRLTDILLRDAQCLLHAQFHRQSVGVPSGLPLYLISLHGLVAAEDVLDGAGHHVVDARHTVGRGRPFIEHE